MHVRQSLKFGAMEELWPAAAQYSYIARTRLGLGPSKMNFCDFKREYGQQKLKICSKLHLKICCKQFRPGRRVTNVGPGPTLLPPRDAPMRLPS